MNNDTAEVVFDVVERLTKLVTDQKPVAVVVFDGDEPAVLTDFSYWESDEHRDDFERRAATRGQEVKAQRGAFGTPMVVQEDETSISYGPPGNGPLPEGAFEQLWIFSFDVEEGFDLSRVLFTRRPDGTPVFDEPQTYQGGAQLFDGTPGFTLLRHLLNEED